MVECQSMRMLHCKALTASMLAFGPRVKTLGIAFIKALWQTYGTHICCTPHTKRGTSHEMSMQRAIDR